LCFEPAVARTVELLKRFVVEFDDERRDRLVKLANGEKPLIAQGR
jgi:hypothetical protein